MTNAIPDDPTALAIVKKRRELQATRAELEKQIKAIDASIALLGKAIAVFDPATKLHLDAHGLKARRFPHTKRFVLSILREADGPLSPVQIAQAWMLREQVEDTPANRRVIRGRVAACLQNCRAQGVAESDGEGSWTLTDKA